MNIDPNTVIVTGIQLKEKCLIALHYICLCIIGFMRNLLFACYTPRIVYAINKTTFEIKNATIDYYLNRLTDNNFYVYKIFKAHATYYSLSPYDLQFICTMMRCYNLFNDGDPVNINLHVIDNLMTSARIEDKSFFNVPLGVVLKCIGVKCNKVNIINYSTFVSTEHDVFDVPMHALYNPQL